MSNTEIKVTKKGDAIELSVAFKVATKDGYEVTCSSASLIPVRNSDNITEDMCNRLKEIYEISLAGPTIRLEEFIISSRTGEEMKRIADDPDVIQMTSEEMEKIPEMIEEVSDMADIFIPGMLGVLGDNFVGGANDLLNFDGGITVSDGPVLRP